MHVHMHVLINNLCCFQLESYYYYYYENYKTEIQLYNETFINKINVIALEPFKGF